MAVFDLQAFLEERARAFDENVDVSPGSPFDTQVIQPLLRRLGRDPFTVDLAVFLHDRLKQAFPELATDEGDAITDLLIKPATLLWDPIVREIFRIRQSLSFRDPATLTTEEAEALGANIFSEREKGEVSRGAVRMFFSQPRTLSVSPTNFFTSRSGLHYFPDGLQSITLEEMLLNFDGSLYYFDVNVVAERAGTEYDISPGEIVTVANVESAVRVTNLRRFRGGSNEESASAFIDRARQELTERSLVTLRGIGAQIPRAFPEVSRLGVVGFGDPEMQRDVIQGGGLGEILAAGSNLNGELDGESKVWTRRLRLAPPNGQSFTELVGPPGRAPSGFVLTLLGAFGGVPPFARDLRVERVVAPDLIEVESQVLNPFAMAIPWTLRKKELTLSAIPGGILFPDSPSGAVTVPEDTIHIGGAYDVLVRGRDVESRSLVIDGVSDDEPAAEGLLLTLLGGGQVSLGDFVLGGNYADGDSTFDAFEEAREQGLSLEILSGPGAGTYRVISVFQMLGASPLLTLDVAVPAAAGTFRWRLVDVLEIDLVEPKETRVRGGDLETLQNEPVVRTASATDFMALGVSSGDTLRILNGPDAGDFRVKAVPAFNEIEVDRPLTSSAASLRYVVFRPNSAGGLVLPLIRVTGVELLDASKQPAGTKIPYAKPVDIRSRAAQNPGRGVKVSVKDAELGIVSIEEPVGGFVLGGLTLVVSFPGSSIPNVSLIFSGTLGAEGVASEVNLAAAAVLGGSARLAAVVGTSRVGILPVARIVVVAGGTARPILFGLPDQVRTTADIRSAAVDAQGGWSAVSPALDEDGLDVAMVLDGTQIGFYGGLRTGGAAVGPEYSGLLFANAGAADFSPVSKSFSPEIGRALLVGARSLGSARCYFLEPTSVEFDADSVFSTTLSDGAVVRFFVDPTVRSVRIPAPPESVLPKDGQSSAGGSAFTATGPSQDFVLSGIRAGDELEVLHVPILGAFALADPVLGLALQTVVLSVDGGPDQTITFASDLPGSPSDVSRAGVVAQINRAVGRAIAKIGAGSELELEADVSVIVRASGSANALLGLGSADRSNASPHAGRYVIATAFETELVIQGTFPLSGGTVERQSFRVLRPGSQRVSSTEMARNVAEAGLFFADVELVSEGTGDLWNIGESLQFRAEGFRADGYFLSTDDPNLSFSSVERPKLHLSRSILEVGVSDDPRNATEISRQNLEIRYERSPLVGDVQSFVSSDTERVICANPLSRHLVPAFVRFDLEYTGGSRAELVLRDIETYIERLFPADLLESGDLQNLVFRRGATSVKNPIDLIAVVHGADRSLVAERSQNALGTGRLRAFIPDVINVSRKTT